MICSRWRWRRVIILSSCMQNLETICRATVYRTLTVFSVVYLSDRSSIGVSFLGCTKIDVRYYWSLMSTRSRVHLWSLSSFELINSTVFQDATDWRSCNSTCTLNLLRCLMGMRRVLLRANEVLNKLTVLFSHQVFWKAGPLNFIYAPGYLLSIE